MKEANSTLPVKEGVMGWGFKGDNILHTANGKGREDDKGQMITSGQC